MKLNLSEIILYCVAGSSASIEYNGLFQYKEYNPNNYANKYLLEFVLPDHIHTTSPAYHIYQRKCSIKHNLISEHFPHLQQFFKTFTLSHCFQVQTQNYHHP